MSLDKQDLLKELTRFQEMAQTWFKDGRCQDLVEAICTDAILSDDQRGRLAQTMKTEADVVLRACFFTMYGPPGGMYESHGVSILRKFTDDFIDSEDKKPEQARKVVLSVLDPLLKYLEMRDDKKGAALEISSLKDRVERLDRVMTGLMASLFPIGPQP